MFTNGILQHRLSECSPGLLGTGAVSFKRLLGGALNNSQSSRMHRTVIPSSKADTILRRNPVWDRASVRIQCDFLYSRTIRICPGWYETRFIVDPLMRYGLEGR